MKYNKYRFYLQPVLTKNYHQVVNARDCSKNEMKSHRLQNFFLCTDNSRKKKLNVKTQSSSSFVVLAFRTVEHFCILQFSLFNSFTLYSLLNLNHRWWFITVDFSTTEHFLNTVSSDPFLRHACLIQISSFLIILVCPPQYSNFNKILSIPYFSGFPILLYIRLYMNHTFFWVSFFQI